MAHAGIDQRSSAPPARDALRWMLRDKRLERRSDQTIETYERNIGKFVEFYGAERPVDEIDSSVIKNYARTILDRDVTDETYAHYMREVKVFVRWLASENYLERAPKVLLPTLHPKTRLNLVTDTDFAKLLAGVAGRTVWNLRDAALLGLLYDSGARISEVTGLSTGDVNLGACEAFVTGKGRKERTIFFSEDTAGRMLRYRRMLERVANPDPYFVSRSLEPLTRDAASAILDRAKAKSGVSCDVNPHNFRHSFATRFIRNGGNPTYLRRLLGHSTLKMTEYYVSLVDDDIREAHHEYSRKRPRTR